MPVPAWGVLCAKSMPPIYLWPKTDVRMVEVLHIAAQVTSDLRMVPEGSVPTDGVLLVMDGYPATEVVMENARRDPATRLLPIALLSTQEHPAPHAAYSDLRTSPDPGAVREALFTMRRILEEVQSLIAEDSSLTCQSRELDLLRFVHTRELNQLLPTFESESRVGFRFRLCEAMLHLDPLATADVLEELVQAGLLAAECDDQVFLCPSCESRHLLFRETCPQCDTPTLSTVSLLHHFYCAHTARTEEFRHNDQLICPKCNRVMRHIGVDYDKPQSTMECANCSEQWVEGQVKIRCLDCDNRCKPEAASVRTVHRYRPTPALHRAALEPVPPLWSTNKILSYAMQGIEPMTYRVVLDHTLGICERYGRPASLVRITPRGLDELSTRKGRFGLHDAVTTMANFLAKRLRTTDMYAVDEDNTIDILMPETGRPGAEAVVKCLQESFQHLRALGVTMEFDIISLP